MLAVTRDDVFDSGQVRPAPQLTPRAAVAFWFAASAGGWLVIGGLLRAVGLF